MKLLRYGAIGQERPAVWAEEGWAYDLGDIVDDFDQAFFADNGVAFLRELVAAGELTMVSLDGVRLGAPIAKPYQVLCIGLNYHDHIEEVGAETPAEPTVFNKGPRTVIGPDDDVWLPPGSETTDWEVELALVIGREARYLEKVEDAQAHVAGYSISNDLSERTFQLDRGGQWVKGKSCETFNPLGPWLLTPDEVEDPQDLELRLAVNGESMQHSNTKEMIFGVNYLIWYLSQFMILEPGDLINTGTPAGVGLGKDPKVYLGEGDVMDVEIAGLGRQCQRVRRALP